MPSTKELLDEKRLREEIIPNGSARKKKPSGKGDGIWETNRAIKKYRKSRDKKNKAQKIARKKNR